MYCITAEKYQEILKLYQQFLKNISTFKLIYISHIRNKGTHKMIRKEKQQNV